MDHVDSNEIGEHETLNGAVFAQEVWQPEDFNDLKLTLGTRYDYNQIYGQARGMLDNILNTSPSTYTSEGAAKTKDGRKQQPAPDG